MKRYMLLFLLFASQMLYAQQKELDSLLNLYSKAKADTVRLELLNNIAFDYSNINPSKGLQAANNAIALAEALDNNYQLATAYNYKGLNCSALGQDTLAIALYNKCLQLRQKLHDYHGIARVYHNIGISYFNLTDYPKSLQFQQKSLDIFRTLNEDDGVASARNSIGTLYLYLSDYPEALNNYFKALSIFEKQANKINAGRVLGNIGLIYSHLEEYQKALAYHFKALKIFKALGDNYNMQNTLGNIGNTYDDSGKPDQALQFYNQALQINRQMNNKTGLASNITNIGIVYQGMNDYQQALYYLQQALPLYNELGNKHGAAIVLNYMANIYCYAPSNVLMHYGVKPAERYLKAVDYQQQGLALSEAAGSLANQSDAWSNLSEIYAAKKDYANALKAYKTYISLRDSMINDDKKSAITRMEMQYAFEKKAALVKAENDKKAALAAAEIKRQRIVKNAAMGGTAALVIAAFSGIFFYKRKRDAENEKLEAEFKAEVADTEMKALRSQMNPHFIFNSLNSINDYITKHDIDAADYYLTKFAKLMRMILEYSEQKEIRLADDLAALELYMQLECLRLNHKFTYEIKVDKNIDLDNTLVPPLILQPFVENSIWHGIAKKKGYGKITIYIHKEGQMINCIVEDNGVGRNKAAEVQKTDKKSFGMKITKARIDIMNRMKKSNAEVEAHDLAEGTRIEVKLPLELSF